MSKRCTNFDPGDHAIVDDDHLCHDCGEPKSAHPWPQAGDRVWVSNPNRYPSGIVVSLHTMAGYDYVQLDTGTHEGIMPRYIMVPVYELRKTPAGAGATQKLPPQRPDVAGPNSADDLRRQGWTVAVHNDYRQGGVEHTFWLVTKDGREFHGEGPRDEDALNAIRQQIRNSQSND
jgi:hypothetical protein